jgi:sarcosine oxidase subunit gamma
VHHYSSDEATKAQNLGLADLSTLPRVGFKGPGTLAWAEQCGVHLPHQPNWASKQPDATLVARLSSSELMMIGDYSGYSPLIDRLAEADRPERVYLLPRADSHSWLTLCGSHAPDTLAKVCGIDLRPQHFENGQIAQTSLAKINTIILRSDIGNLTNYAIFSDSSSVEYLWDSLLDAMAEHLGSPVGLQALIDNR